MIQTKIILFSKHKDKAEFKNLADSLDFSSDFSSAVSMTSTASITSVPYQPQFIKTFTDLDGWIIPGTQMTNTSPFLW